MKVLASLRRQRALDLTMQRHRLLGTMEIVGVAGVHPRTSLRDHPIGKGSSNVSPSPDFAKMSRRLADSRAAMVHHCLKLLLEVATKN